MPSIPETVPGRGPTSTAPTPIPSLPGGGKEFYPFRPEGQKKGFASHPSDANGCRVVDYHSGGSGRTCRWIASESVMRSNIGENGYKIEANLHIGDLI